MEWWSDGMMDKEKKGNGGRTEKPNQLNEPE